MRPPVSLGEGLRPPGLLPDARRVVTARVAHGPELHSTTYPQELEHVVSNLRAGIDGLHELINRSGSTNTVRSVHADEKSDEIAIFLTCHPVSAKRMRRIFTCAALAACSSRSEVLTQFVILSNFQEDEARKGSEHS